MGFIRRLIDGVYRRLFFKAAVKDSHWDTMVDKVESGQHTGWLDSPFVETEYIRSAISGDRTEYYLNYFFRTHTRESSCNRGLSLGCGGGNLERAIIKRGWASSVDAYDSSAASIDLARSLATEEGLGEKVQYEVADINQLVLPEHAYDWIICKMSLHHFEALEHVYQQICKALKPGCCFMFNEYIGPSRHQFTDVQLRLMTEMMDTLPPELRSQIPFPRFERMSEEQMIEIDPTEAVRSAEIMPVLTHYFDVVEYKPYGGTLLHILLQHVLPLVNMSNPYHESILRMYFLFEKTLLQSKVIDSDFAYVVARPK